MTRRLTLACALAALGCALLPAAGQARTDPYDLVTVPVIPHLKLTAKGKTYYTDKHGKVTLALPGVRTDQVRDVVHVSDKRLGPDAVAKFDRWFGHSTLTFNLMFHMRFAFHDLAGNAVDPKLVSSIVLKSRTGVHTTLKGGESAWLQGSRVVPFTGKLVSKDIDYQVERAYVDGANVVNQAQQRFAPHKTRNLSVRLLFYRLKVITRDALFGFAVGQSVELRYPSGRTVTHDLKDGRVTLPALPRGTYNLKVKASGVSFTRPVSVSRNQEVELKVISWLDMVLALGALAALAIGLMLFRRPELARKVKRKLRLERRQTVGAGK